MCMEKGKKGGQQLRPSKLLTGFNKDILVGGLEHLLFFHVLGIIIPIDELIVFRGVGQPPTSNIQY